MFRVMVCPNCETQRKIPPSCKKARCAGCHKRIKITPDVLIAKDKRFALFKAKREKVIGDAKVVGIRADCIPLSMHEARFKRRCADRGWTIHRPSWPDYIVETETGMIAVEVKGGKDEVSFTQAATFDVLESMGIRVFVWRDGTDALARWARYKPTVKSFREG